ncbi:MAG: hypothetical protein SVE93_01040 [Candidatus Thermoplasmatota archaeon]|nr:hypothetical protein [Candidatus Thermoplasmatota archaeon]
MNKSHAYIAIHYALGLLLFIFAPSAIALKVILTALYALLVPLFFLLSRNRDMLFLGHFTLAVYPFFAVALYFLGSEEISTGLLALIISCALAVTALFSYRRSIAIEAGTEPGTEAETETETKETADQGVAMLDTEQSLESYISRVEEIIKEERERNEKLKERIREIKEKIDSLQ